MLIVLVRVSSENAPGGPGTNYRGEQGLVRLRLEPSLQFHKGQCSVSSVFFFGKLTGLSHCSTAVGFSIVDLIKQFLHGRFNF